MSEEPMVVADIVRDVLGDEPIAVEHIPTLEDSHVFRVQVPSGTVFFKSEHEGHPIDIAAWAYEKAATVGVPVPDVLHLDTTRESWPDDFMVITAADGSDLQNDPLEGAALIDAIERAGALLARQHSIALEGFGHLGFRTPEADPVGEYPDPSSFVRHSADWGMPYIVERRLIDASTCDTVREILERHEELFAPSRQGVLLHDDLGLDHIFLEREKMRITGIIDFQPCSGDPTWDIAVFGFHYPDLVRHLIDGYGDGLPDDLDVRVELYGLSRAFGCARWDHERGFDIAHPLDEIRRRSSALAMRLSG